MAVCAPAYLFGWATLECLSDHFLLSFLTDYGEDLPYIHVHILIHTGKKLCFPDEGLAGG
jgi:hypothetical protein